MNNKVLTMKLIKESLAVCRLEKDDTIPLLFLIYL